MITKWISVTTFRLAQIEENMKNMGRIIEDYRNRMHELRAKRREEKQQAKLKALEAQRLGFNLKDPRALQMLGGDKKSKRQRQKKTWFLPHKKGLGAEPREKEQLRYSLLLVEQIDYPLNSKMRKEEKVKNKFQSVNIPLYLHPLYMCKKLVTHLSSPTCSILLNNQIF